MKVLDRSLIRQFLLTALFSLAAVTVIFVVIDAMEKLDNFIDRQASAGIIVRYYLFFIPEIIKLITPVAMLLASLFVTARMSSQNEITAMRAGGISLYRILRPFVAVALVVTAFSVWFNGWIVPLANREKLALERNYLSNTAAPASAANLFIQDSPTRILTIGFYEDQSMSASRISIQDFDAADRTILRARADAASMSWDTVARRWILKDGVRRTFRNDRETLEEFAVSPAGPLHLAPEDLRRKQEKPDEMDYYSLRAFIANQQRAGQDVARWQVDFYSKVSFPFATVIVVLFGVPFSSVKRRGGVGVQLGISLLICFIYLIFMKVSQVFGYNGDLDPLLTAWIANIIFLAAAAAVILGVRK
ncbi:MAG: LPS export ABC transporter permease LptG [Bacteroidota bacterium]